VDGKRRIGILKFSFTCFFEFNAISDCDIQPPKVQTEGIIPQEDFELLNMAKDLKIFFKNGTGKVLIHFSVFQRRYSPI